VTKGTSYQAGHFSVKIPGQFGAEINSHQDLVRRPTAPKPTSRVPRVEKSKNYDWRTWREFDDDLRSAAR